MTPPRVTIVGAGLIGGSVALATRRANPHTWITAIDHHPAPHRTDVADHWIDAANQTEVDEALARAELTVLCTPVRVIASLLPRALDLGTGVVTDCGSTKLTLIEAVAAHPRSSHYVPGHPMAGSPTGGLENARAELFDDRRWLLCPTGTRADAKALVEDFVTALGARPILLDALRHDRSVALTSHVPQVVASALSVLVDEEDATVAAGPGFASSTRVAGGAESMWRDIFETNGPAIGRGLELLGARLVEVGARLREGESEAALQLLERARDFKKRSGRIE